MPEEHQQAEHENILWAVTSGMARMPAFVTCIAGTPLAMPGGTTCRMIVYKLNTLTMSREPRKLE